MKYEYRVENPYTPKPENAELVRVTGQDSRCWVRLWEDDIPDHDRWICISDGAGATQLADITGGAPNLQCAVYRVPVSEPAASPGPAAAPGPGADIVNRPAHYTSGPRHSVCGEVIECIDVSETFTSNAGQALQYIWRHLHKGSSVEDLRKAAWFCTREAARLERAASGEHRPRDPQGEK